jgi:hypothetical protein
MSGPGRILNVPWRIIAIVIAKIFYAIYIVCVDDKDHME